MKKEKTLPVQNVMTIMSVLGLEQINDSNKQQVWQDPESNVKVEFPVHHGRCYQSTLANALYNLSGHPVINYSKILISGNIPHFSEMQPSQNTPIKLEPLPYDLSRRNLGHDKLVKVLTEAGWDMVSQRGSHFNYQPKLDGFKGSFAITHHGGREKYQSAKQTQRYLRNLMKVNHDPEAQGVITHLQGCFIEALKL